MDLYFLHGPLRQLRIIIPTVSEMGFFIVIQV